MSKSTKISYSVGAILLLVAPQFLGTYHVGLLVLIFIWAIAATSLDIVMGYTGLPSLGHAAFFGGAAYIVALLVVKTGNHGFWVPLAAGLATALVLGAAYGFVALRAKEVYLMLITLALAQLLWAIAWQWRGLTGGSEGLSGVNRPDLVVVPWSLWPPANFYYFSLAFFILTVVVKYVVVHSAFGRTLVGVRENENRMAVLGYNVWLHKYLAFLLGSVLAGLAGVLFAYYNGTVTPSALGVPTSAKLLIMVLLGGAGTLFGPILGAASIVMLQNYLGVYTERWMLALGLIYVVVVLFTPCGLVGLANQFALRRLIWRIGKFALRGSIVRAVRKQVSGPRRLA